MKKKTSFRVGIPSTIALIVCLVVIILAATSLAKAKNDRQSETGYLVVNPNAAVNARTTDAIQVAVTQAKALGMTNDPLAMRITQGRYQDFQPIDETDSLYDAKNVYAVWLITEPFQIIAPGARSRTVTQLVFFIDTQNGHPFGFTYGSSIEPQLNNRIWQSVTFANAGQYAVPEFDPDNLIPIHTDQEPAPAEPTETPLQ